MLPGAEHFLPKVENTLFRVPKERLVENSDIFESMFSLPSEEEKAAEGLTKDCPIKLHGLSSSEFRALMDILYPSPTA